MNIQDVQAFVSVVDTGSVSAAAEALFVTKSAVSHRLRSLEDELGFQVLSRAGRKGVELTPEGVQLLESARNAVVTFDRFAQVADEVRANTRSLRIEYTGPHFESDIITGAAEILQASHPGFIVHPAINAMSASADELLKGNIDMALSTKLVIEGREGLTFASLCDVRLKLAVPKSHRLAKRLRVSLSELEGETIVLPERKFAPQGYDSQIAYMKLAGVKNYRVESVGNSNFETVLATIASGRGFTLMASWYANPHPARIAYVDLDDDFAKYNTSLIWRSDDTNQLITAFVQAAKEYVACTYPQWASKAK